MTTDKIIKGKVKISFRVKTRKRIFPRQSSLHKGFCSEIRSYNEGRGRWSEARWVTKKQICICKCAFYVNDFCKYQCLKISAMYTRSRVVAWCRFKIIGTKRITRSLALLYRFLSSGIYWGLWSAVRLFSQSKQHDELHKKNAGIKMLMCKSVFICYSMFLISLRSFPLFLFLTG